AFAKPKSRTPKKPPARGRPRPQSVARRTRAGNFQAQSREQRAADEDVRAPIQRRNARSFAGSGLDASPGASLPLSVRCHPQHTLVFKPTLEVNQTHEITDYDAVLASSLVAPGSHAQLRPPGRARRGFATACLEPGLSRGAAQR